MHNQFLFLGHKIGPLHHIQVNRLRVVCPYYDCVPLPGNLSPQFAASRYDPVFEVDIYTEVKRANYQDLHLSIASRSTTYDCIFPCIGESAYCTAEPQNCPGAPKCTRYVDRD